jgi:hypothetical protein
VEGSSSGATEANTETFAPTETPDTTPSSGGVDPSLSNTEGATETDDTTGGSTGELSGGGTTKTEAGGVPLSCGNGLLDPGEACDDGSNPNAPAHNGPDQPCTPSCELAVCGDGQVLAPSGDDPGEECDAGDNTSEYGGCTAECVRAPHCGDKIVQPEHEVCECLGRNEDSCDVQTAANTVLTCIAATCQFDAKLVFLADPEGPVPGWSGNFDEIDGINAADWICDALADEAGLIPNEPEDAENPDAPPTAPRFRAWLSTKDKDVKTRFTTYEGLYVQRSGAIVATSWSDLVTNGPASPITATQHDNLSISDVPVWSNTNMDGSWLSDTLTCINWTDASFGLDAYVGNNKVSDDPKVWTYDVEQGLVACKQVYRLYCFQQ